MSLLLLINDLLAKNHFTLLEFAKLYRLLLYADDLLTRVELTFVQALTERMEVDI